MVRTAQAVSMVLGGFCLAGLALAQVDLAVGFGNPPDSAKPHTWWHWMNGNVTREGITADLEAMKRIGLGGAQIFNVSEHIPEGPIAYNSDEWRSLVKHAASEAKRLGIELCIHNCAGWSSSGGPWVTPEHAMQTVVTTEMRAIGPARWTGVIPQPTAHKGTGYYRDIAVLAFPTVKDENVRIDDIRAKALYEYKYGLAPTIAPAPAEGTIRRESIVDLTGKLDDDGRLAWDMPAGEWTILRIGYTPTGAVNAPAPNSGRGLEVDKMSREAFDAYWAGGMEPLLKELGSLAGEKGSLRNVLVDSYEVGCQNWTPRFRDEFNRRRGYDPIVYLPAMSGLIVDTREVSERFLWDMRRTIGDLFADNYYSYFAEVCKNNGLLSSVEPYDGPFECSQVGRDADIVMGEFWVTSGMSYSCKLASSVGHVHGKRIVGAESFTAEPNSGKWLNYPGSVKAVGDLMYTEGINRYIIHRYAHQPWANIEPGMTMGQWGTHFERTTTWWEHGGPEWIAYLTRCQYMLQRGRFVADVLYCAGEAAPNGAPHEIALKRQGYDYDSCGADALAHAAMKDGRIVLPSGMSYAVLVMPDTPFMTPALLETIERLVRDGATVIAPRPTASPSLAGYPQTSQQVAVRGAAIWGDCDGESVKEHAVGKGRIVWGRTVREVLAGMKIEPDCVFSAPSGLKPSATWIHRAEGGTDFYFISNQKPRSEEIECSFRVGGNAPELWHADTGRIEPAPIWREQNGRTIVPIAFDPSGSVFVVFRGPSAARHLTSVKPPPNPDLPRVPKFIVTKARYEAIDGAGGVDVTAKVAALVDAGELAIPATNAMFGDPTYNHVKRLVVEYTRDGAPMQGAADENRTLVLFDLDGPDVPAPYAVRVTPAGEIELRAYRAGAYQVTEPGGSEKTLHISAVPAPIEIKGPWSVSFQRGPGASQSVAFDTLASWTQSADPDIKYYSGTAEYRCQFEVSSEQLGADAAVRLDLGDVRVIAEVTLNGRSLGTWWKPPFVADVTGVARPGKNSLCVRVTNLWVNRLIGDEQFPDDCEWSGIHIKNWPAWFDPASDNPLRNRPTKQRQTFTTWKHWTKDSPLLDSGLLGPVVLRPSAPVIIK
ncbi:MAG: glycosyl hydrolase [Phycisphaerales bacterium]